MFVIPLVIHLHHLSLGKPVAAGAPGGGAGSEVRLIGVVLPQGQGVGIEGAVLHMEEHRQFHPAQGLPLSGLGQVDDSHGPAAPGAGPGFFVFQVV